MRSYFIDTNVIIDFLAYRDGYDVAAELLSRAKHGEYTISTSVLSFANIAYILRKVLKGDVLYDTLAKLSFIKTTPMSIDDYQRALAMKAKDFEDALQYRSAMSFGCEAIITNNIKDFDFSEIPVITPTDFVNR